MDTQAYFIKAWVNPNGVPVKLERLGKGMMSPIRLTADHRIVGEYRSQSSATSAANALKWQTE